MGGQFPSFAIGLKPLGSLTSFTYTVWGYGFPAKRIDSLSRLKGGSMENKSTPRTRIGGRVGKIVIGVLAGFLLLPIPALGLTFLGPWNFTNLQINAPTPLTLIADAVGSTRLTVDMGRNGITSAAGPTGSFVNPGAVSIFTATRPITVPVGGEFVSVTQTYQTLLQGATQQSVLYFDPINNNAANRIYPQPNTFNSQGIRFANVFNGSNSSNPFTLPAGQYNVVIRIKFKKDRFGIWDNSNLLPGTPYQAFIF
jgi:hypothetical protein